MTAEHHTGVGREELDGMDFNDLAGSRARSDTPIHPGEILQEEFMQPLELSASALAHLLHVPPNRITALVKGQRSVTADTALRLARYFGTRPEFWLHLQVDFEPGDAEREVGGAARKDVSPRVA